MWKLLAIVRDASIQELALICLGLRHLFGLYLGSPQRRGLFALPATVELGGEDKVFVIKSGCGCSFLMMEGNLLLI